MSLKYDFDIHWVIPREMFADPKLGEMLGETGLEANARGNYVALFRDPATAEALRGASSEVQEFFKACGFGFNTYESGAPEGRFPASDEAAHTDVLTRMNENLQKFDLKGADMNGFSFTGFLDHVSSAQPIEMEATMPPPEEVQTPKRFGLLKLFVASFLVIAAGHLTSMLFA